MVCWRADLRVRRGSAGASPCIYDNPAGLQLVDNLVIGGPFRAFRVFRGRSSAVIIYYGAAAKPDGPRTTPREIGIVRHQHERGAAFPIESEDQVHHRLRRFVVEVARRSSQNSIFGRLTKARANDTRCCRPPESCNG